MEVLTISSPKPPGRFSALSAIIIAPPGPQPTSSCETRTLSSSGLRANCNGSAQVVHALGLYLRIPDPPDCQFDTSYLSTTAHLASG